MIDFQNELNKEQLGVVLNGDGPCLVLAGAGSGKTRTITYRVAYLLEQGVSADQILLVTFTNKAAREMLQRVALLTNGEGHLPWAGTFHHIAYRLLRKYAPLIGYKNNFTILDSSDSLDLLKLCLKQEGIDRKQRRFPSPAVLQSLISFSRNAQMPLETVLEEQHPQWLDIQEILLRIAADYERRKREAGVMDFDDLLVNTHLLLVRSEQVRKKFSEQFQYVLVDEYQDTNAVQAGLVRIFSSHHKNLLVVGDDAQSIYSFRAARIENILEFSAQDGDGYPNAKIFYLTTNYRSTPNILDVANDVISNNVHQYQKNLKSLKEPFIKPEVHTFSDQPEEADFIAGRILELRDEGIALPHMAVLFRAAHHSQALEIELVRRDIPYEYRGGVRFFERGHIKDVLAYLRIFSNQDDVIAWSRVLNMQVGIGPANAERIMTVIRLSTSETFESVSERLPSRAQIGWNDFLNVWKSMLSTRDEDEKAATADLIQAILDSKYTEYLENEYPDYRERLQDIEQLALFAERQPDMEQFLAEATLQESYAARDMHRDVQDEEGKIVLSTVHQAKGLEWEAVFVINVANGQFPNDRALRSSDSIEEERRLFYVAITRAKKYLTISYPLVAGMNVMLQGPSMFLEEINRDLLDEYGVGGATTFFDPSDAEDGISYEPEEGFGSRWEKQKKSFLKDIDDL